MKFYEVPLTTLLSTSFLAEYWIHRPTGPWSRPVPPIVHMSTCHHTSAHLIAADGSLSPVSCPGEVNNANISLNICVVLMEELFVGNFMLQQHWLWLHKQGARLRRPIKKISGSIYQSSSPQHVSAQCGWNTSQLVQDNYIIRVRLPWHQHHQ